MKIYVTKASSDELIVDGLGCVTVWFGRAPHFDERAIVALRSQATITLPASGWDSPLPNARIRASHLGDGPLSRLIWSAVCDSESGEANKESWSSLTASVPYNRWLLEIEVEEIHNIPAVLVPRVLTW